MIVLPDLQLSEDAQFVFQVEAREITSGVVPWVKHHWHARLGVEHFLDTHRCVPTGPPLWEGLPSAVPISDLFKRLHEPGRVACRFEVA